MKIQLFSLSVCLCLLSTGCSYIQARKTKALFGPEYAQKLAGKYFSEPDALSKIRAEFNAGLTDALGATTDGAKVSQLAIVKAKRNDVIYDMLAISDSLYGEFKDSVFTGKASIDTGVKVLDLALTGTAVAVGDKGTKTALAAAATFLGGTKLAVDENFYAKQTTTSLISIMDGRRALVLVELRNGMERSPELFTLGAGLNLVQEYHRAGSMVDAVVEISRLSGAEAQKQVQLLRETRTK